MTKSILCDVCGAQAIYTSNAAIYNGKQYGKWPHCWLCPECGAYVGTHAGTQNPLGSLATKETHQHRRQAHAVFDSLWQQGRLPSRRKAYLWLAARMGIEPSKCHIGMMTIEQCKRVVEVCEAFEVEAQEY